MFTQSPEAWDEMFPDRTETSPIPPRSLIRDLQAARRTRTSMATAHREIDRADFDASSRPDLLLEAAEELSDELGHTVNAVDLVTVSTGVRATQIISDDYPATRETTRFKPNVPKSVQKPTLQDPLIEAAKKLGKKTRQKVGIIDLGTGTVRLRPDTTQRRRDGLKFLKKVALQREME